MTTTRKVGAIVRLFPDRVFGFIHCPEDARDYFFHQAQLENCTFGQLTEGAALTFTVGERDGRVEAREIVLDEPPAAVVTEKPRRAQRSR